MPLIDDLSFPPQPDESARGLIARIGGENACQSSDIVTHLGLSRMEWPLEGNLEWPAAELGMPTESFAAMGASDGENEAFLGRWVTAAAIMRWAMRVCPACIAERPYHRRVWAHGHLGVCPRHRLRLIETCQACAAERECLGTLRWCSSDVATCGHGHSLAEQSAPPAQGWRGHAALYRLLGLDCDGPDFPEPFRNLPLQALLELLGFLGRMEVVVARATPTASRARR